MFEPVSIWPNRSFSISSMKSNKIDSYSPLRIEFLCPFGLRRLYSLLHFDCLVEHPDEKKCSLSIFPSQSSFAIHL